MNEEAENEGETLPELLRRNEAEIRRLWRQVAKLEAYLEGLE